MLNKVDKFSKILATVLFIVMLTSILGTVVCADIVGSGLTTNTTGDTAESVRAWGGQIVGIVQVIGYVIAVIILVFIGIKWITSSPEGKAEIKKTALIYIGGAVLIAAAVTIAGMIFTFGETQIS